MIVVCRYYKSVVVKIIRFTPLEMYAFTLIFLAHTNCYSSNNSYLCMALETECFVGYSGTSKVSFNFFLFYTFLSCELEIIYFEVVNSKNISFTSNTGVSNIRSVQLSVNVLNKHLKMLLQNISSK